MGHGSLAVNSDPRDPSKNGDPFDHDLLTHFHLWPKYKFLVTTMLVRLERFLDVNINFHNVNGCKTRR